MKNKKILLVCQYFFPEKISSGVLPYELSKKIAEKYSNVTALVGYPKEYLDSEGIINKNEKHAGVVIKRIKYVQGNRRKKMGRLINMISFAVSVLIHPVEFIKNDYYICFTNPPILPFVCACYAKIFGKKQITVIYDLYPDSPIKLGYIRKDSMISKTFEKLNKFVFNSSYKIIAISGEMKQYLVEFKGVDPKKIEIIHNWYDDKYGDEQIKLKKQMQILYGGNMGVAQDMDTIRETIRLLKNDDRFMFLFAGHGSKKEEIQSFIKEEKIENCIMYDFLPKEEYERLLSDCQMSILSLERSVVGIGSPSKYYGYLALKKPIIAILPDETDIAKDIKEYKIGLHILNGDAIKLKSELIALYENMDVLEEMSKNAYSMFKEKYTLEKASEKYINLLEGGSYDSI